MRFIGIIPARYASTRFPGKPLATISGKTMIQRVYEQCLKCSLLNDLVVATDDQRIFDHVSGFGQVLMTGSNHQSGTDRCLEALDMINIDKQYADSDCLINIQGDEPFISPEQIELLVNRLSQSGKNILTLIKKIREEKSYFDPNQVKVVFTNNHKALYFSRAPIPFYKHHQKETKNRQLFGYKHIGLYGFRIKTLRQITKIDEGTLEQAESLEQLRWLQHGFEIFLVETQHESIAVDTPADLDKLLRMTG